MGPGGTSKDLAPDRPLTPVNIQAPVKTLPVNYNYDSWANMAKELCKPGISAKFFQNPDLAKMFEMTGNKSLVEACYEKLWGTGIPLHHPDCLNQDKW